MWTVDITQLFTLKLSILQT